MKVTYETPVAEKLDFNYASVVVASGYECTNKGHQNNHGDNGVNVHSGQGCQ